MGVIANNASVFGSTGARPPAVPQSYLESLGRNVFDVLDASGNFGRSVARFAQTGDPGYLGNAAKIVLPFIESEKVPIEDITNSKNFWYNLGAEVVLDPLSYVGGFLPAAKRAATATKVLQIKREASIFKSLGDIERASEARTAIKKLIETAPARTDKKQSLLSVGLPIPFTPTIDIGDAKKLTETFKSLGFDRRIAGVIKESDRIEKKITDGSLRIGLQEKFREKLSVLNKELNDGKGVLSPSVINNVYRVINFVDDKFHTAVREPVIQTLKDITGIRKRERILTGDRETQDLFNKLKDFGSYADAEFRTNTYRLAESVGVNSDVVRADIQKTLNRQIGSISTSAGKKFDKLVSTGNIDEAAKILDGVAAKITFAKKAAAQREFRVAELEKLKIDANPELLNVIKAEVDANARLLQKEQSLGLRTKELSAQKKGILTYIPRALSDEAKQLSKKNPVLFASIQRDIYPKISAQYKRRFYPETELIEVNRLLREQYGLNFDYFKPDLVQAQLQRKIQSANAIGSAEFLHEGVRNFGQAKQSVTDVQARRVLKRFGIDPKDLSKDLYLPQHVVQDLTKGFTQFHKAVGDTNWVKNVLGKLVHPINSFYRAFLTFGFPGYHFGNYVGNTWQSTLHSSKVLGKLHEGFPIQHRYIAGKMTPADIAEWTKMENLGIVQGKELPGLESVLDEIGLKEISPRGELADRPFTFAGRVVFGKDKLSKPKKFLQNPLKSFDEIFAGVKVHKNPNDFDPLTGRAFGRYLENASRIALFKTAKAEGHSDIGAMRVVNKYLFNYADLTPFEQEYLRPSFLFYTWTRKNIPLAIKSALTNTRQYALYNHITGMNDEDLPQYLQSTNAFVSPWNPQLAIGSLRLPIEDLNLLNVSDVDPNYKDQIHRLVQKVAARLSPALLVPYEVALAGEQAFTGTPLSDTNTMDYIVNRSPFSRFAKVATNVSQSLSEQKAWSTLMIETFTGLRTYKFDPSRVPIDKAKRRLLATGKVAKFPVLVSKKKDDYLTKEKISQFQKMVREQSK